MKMEEQERPIVYLKPGELFVSRESAIVSTVLGSCVSVTMFSPELRMGAICHALLPVENSSGESFRYVDTSILSMLEEFGRHGISRTRLEVKLFGGSSMLSDNAGGYRGVAVGRQNIEKAMQIIEAECLSLVASDLGGTNGRKIYFLTHTGAVFLKHLGKKWRF
jgi:chemotaxis protein CheD